MEIAQVYNQPIWPTNFLTPHNQQSVDNKQLKVEISQKKNLAQKKILAQQQSIIINQNNTSFLPSFSLASYYHKKSWQNVPSSHCCCCCCRCGYPSSSLAMFPAAQMVSGKKNCLKIAHQQCATIILILMFTHQTTRIQFNFSPQGLKCIQGMRGVDSTSGREIDGEFHEVECADHFCAAIRCRVSEGGATAMAKGCRNGTHECSLPERLLPVAWQSDPGKYCECTVCQGDLCNSAQGNGEAKM